jgi:hypothetical protein
MSPHYVGLAGKTEETWWTIVDRVIGLRVRALLNDRDSSKMRRHIFVVPSLSYIGSNKSMEIRYARSDLRWGLNDERLTPRQ